MVVKGQHVNTREALKTASGRHMLCGWSLDDVQGAIHVDRSFSKNIPNWGHLGGSVH